jgi:hypothetical protein
MAQGDAYERERRAAADRQLTVVRINDREGARAICPQLERLIDNVESPRLCVVARRGEHGVVNGRA